MQWSGPSAEADLVIGAVLVAGGRAPVVVTEEMVAAMKRGAVIVDVAVDQGGCIETTRETTHNDPVYEVQRRHPLRRRQHARRRAPHVDLRADQRHAALRAGRGPRWAPRRACRADPALALGCNTVGGHVTNAPVAEFLGLPFVDPLSALSA